MTRPLRAWGDVPQVNWPTVTVKRHPLSLIYDDYVSEATYGTRRAALVIGLDRLDDEGVGNTLVTPLPLVDGEAVRTCGAAAAANPEGGTGRLSHGI